MMSTALSERYFSASLMDNTCVKTVSHEPSSLSISRSKRASPGLSSTRRSFLIDLPIICMTPAVAI